MSAQKGPGEGYGAAKAEALSLKPTLKSRAVFYGSERLGYVVEDPTDDNKQWGRGPNARDAWSEALFCLRNGTRPSLEKTW
jgi:hypothetical protein